MTGLNKDTSQLTWRIELLRDFDVPYGTYAVTVMLQVMGHDLLLSGYGVSCDEGAFAIRHIMQNDFCLGDNQARDLLCRIAENYRATLLGLQGGLGVTMERKRWLAWLDSQYPAQALMMEAQLLLHNEW